MPATGRRSGTPQSIKLKVPPHTVAIELEPLDSLPRLPDERVDLLLVGRGAERRRHDGLRLTALKEPRPVHPRQQADLARDGTDRAGVAAVDAAPAVEHQAAHHVRFAVLEFFLDELRQHLVPFGSELAGEGFDHLLLDGRVAVVARVLLPDDARLSNAGVHELRHAARDLGRDLLDRERALRPAHGRADPLDELDDELALLMREHQRIDEIRLRRLVRAAFDHDDGVLADGDDDVDVRRFGLLEGRIRNELAVHAGDANTRNGAVPRDVRDVQSRRRGGQRHHVRLVDLVGREHGRDDLRVLLVAFREERPERPIDDARRENLVLTKAPFALEEAPGDLAGGIGLFLVFTGQRKEIQARPLVCRNGGDEHHAAPAADEGGAMGLLGETASLDGQRLVADHDGFTNEHVGSAPSALAATCGVTPDASATFSLGS
jgi:hypothetical protein